METSAASEFSVRPKRASAAGDVLFSVRELFGSSGKSHLPAFGFHWKALKGVLVSEGLE
jgi:hypothetical protein